MIGLFDLGQIKTKRTVVLERYVVLIKAYKKCRGLSLHFLGL